MCQADSGFTLTHTVSPRMLWPEESGPVAPASFQPDDSSKFTNRPHMGDAIPVLPACGDSFGLFLGPVNQRSEHDLGFCGGAVVGEPGGGGFDGGGEGFCRKVGTVQQCPEHEAGF